MRGITERGTDFEASRCNPVFDVEPALESMGFNDSHRPRRFHHRRSRGGRDGGLKNSLDVEAIG